MPYEVREVWAVKDDPNSSDGSRVTGHRSRAAARAYVKGAVMVWVLSPGGIAISTERNCIAISDETGDLIYTATISEK